MLKRIGKSDYYVADFGQIFRKTGRGMRPIPPHPRQGGYLKVDIGRNGRFVHELVYHYYVHTPNTHTPKWINHANCCKWDNRAENLFASEIRSDPVRTPKYRKGFMKVNNKFEVVEVYYDYDELRAAGYDPRYVQQCAVYKRRAYKGYQWYYFPYCAYDDPTKSFKPEDFTGRDDNSEMYGGECLPDV